MDRDSNGNLDKDDFKWGLRNFGLVFNENEYRLLLETFDTKKDGSIDFNEFIETIRIAFSPNRETLV